MAAGCPKHAFHKATVSVVALCNLGLFFFFSLLIKYILSVWVLFEDKRTPGYSFLMFYGPGSLKINQENNWQLQV